MLDKIRATYHDFPLKFWVLVGANFIDRIGGTMLYPFFALYVTRKFNVGMTEAGLLFGVFSISGLFGSMIGGALTDKYGRRGIVLFGLVFSALSSVAMGFVTEMSLFYVLAFVVGLLGEVASPARQAMVADMLPEKQIGEGFGVMRIAGNLAWIVGPTIGGLLAAESYMLLFILDAISSLITAVIVYKLVPETRPEPSDDQQSQSFMETVVGYRHVAADKMFVAFLIMSMLMMVVYQQMYNTLSVYLRDVHGVSAQGYGFMLSLDAATVVLLQFWVTRKIKPYPPMLMMMAGTLFYLVGFTMYGFVSAYALFIVAILLITVGEMIVMPVSSALVARLAPEDMRGRYMAFFGVVWTIPAAVGPWAAGIILDNYDPNWVWYAGGIICAVAAAGFYLLHLATRSRFSASAGDELSSATL